MSPEEKPKKPTTPVKKETFLAVIRVRGQHDIRPETDTGLKNLNLISKNACSVHKDTPSIRGMLQKVKDYVAWGEIDDATLKLLVEKRGQVSPKDAKKTKKFFRLHPPRGGFERQGIKVGFNAGGALGYRGAKINDLIKKMV